MKYEEMNKEELLLEIYKLSNEVNSYKKRLGIASDEKKPSETIKLPTEEKLTLFANYFAGRNDVVAERYEKDGKKHYAISCLNKWESNCDIRRYHCRNCPSFVPRPYDKKAIEDHIRGQRIIAIYPLLDGNYTNLLVYDLDDNGYLEDTKKLGIILHSHGVNYINELSESGHGIHVWIFFASPIKAKDARSIGNLFLTEAMDKFGGFSLESYDRLFPSQNKREAAGYGSPIALPLTNTFVSEGTTIFLDDDLNQINNPFEKIKETRKITKEEAKQLLEEASNQEEYGLFGEDVFKMPLSKDDFFGIVHLTLAGDLFLNINELSLRARRYFCRLGSMKNKEYWKRVAMHQSTFNIPRILTAYIEEGNFARLPRGYKDSVVRILKAKDIPYSFVNALSKGGAINVSFVGTLRPNQMALVNQLREQDNALIEAPTGFGKTVVAAYLIAQKRVNTLILVNSLSLAKQWISMLSQYLFINYEYTKKPFGEIHTGAKRVTGKIDIALIQSLVRNEEYTKLTKQYGMVIVDEAHHGAAFSYSKVLRSCSSKYLYGLTATPERADELEDIVYKAIGPLVKVNDESSKAGFIKRYHPRFTRFAPSDEDEPIQNIFDELTLDEERNRLIISDVTKAYQEGKKILVLSERIGHIQTLYESLKAISKDIVIVYGEQTTKEKEAFKETMASFASRPFIALSIGKYIGEGFDDTRLDALFITFPFHWKGTLSQYVGRLNRKDTPIKSVDVYDYVDLRSRKLAHMYSARQKGYFDLGYSLVNEKGAYTDLLLNETHYENKLDEDLSNSQNGVVFLVDYHHENKVEYLSKETKAPLSIVLSSTDNAVLSQKHEILIGHMPNAIIIDKRIVYYGGINPFVYSREANTIMRIEDPQLAKEILEGCIK
jgi:superfamily II DNA or RNA helicase